MSSETFNTEINGNKYAYTQLPARESLKLKFTLAGIAGGSIVGASSAIGKSDAVQLEAFGQSISKIFEKNDPDKIIALIERIFEPAFINGERVNIDNHYKGEFSEMYQALFWVLKMEYESFFTGVQSLMTK